MSKHNTFLTKKDRTLLRKVSNLLNEVIETLDLFKDKEIMKSIKKAEEDIKSGRIRDYNEFIGEL